MKWKLHKLLSIIMVFALMICLLPHPVAQAANDKKKIEKSVNTYMSAIKKYNIPKVKKSLINKDVFHITDKRLQKYIRKANSDCLKYEITRIRVKGKTATAYLHVNHYSSQTDFENAISYVMQDYDKSWNSKKFAKELYSWLMWAYDPTDESMLFESNVKIQLEKRGNKWMISKMDKKMLFIKDSGLTEFMDDFTKHPLKYV